MEEKNNINVYYDGIIQVALVNFFTIGKDTKRIVLTNFDRKNPSHKCILVLTGIVQDLWDFQTELVMSRFKYRVLKFTNKHVRCIRSKNQTGTDINEFIKHIEEANDDIGIFEKIYNEYYKEK